MDGLLIKKCQPAVRRSPVHCSLCCYHDDELSPILLKLSSQPHHLKTIGLKITTYRIQIKHSGNYSVIVETIFSAKCLIYWPLVNCLSGTQEIA